MPGGAQFGVEFVGDFSPVGILKNRFAQEAGLRFAPERGFMEPEAFGQRAMGFDEASNGGLVVGLAELGEQVAHVMYGAFHDVLRVIAAGNGVARRACWLESDPDAKFDNTVEFVRLARLEKLLPLSSPGNSINERDARAHRIRNGSRPAIVLAAPRGMRSLRCQDLLPG